MKRVGVIGSGVIGRWHVEQWQHLPVEIAGFYDVQPQQAQAMQADFGGQVYGSLDALVADVDIVDICSITPAHKEGVLAAAAAGKAIVCEKPLARTVADCETMIAACKAANVPLFVAQVVRFFPQFARAKAVIESGAIGTPGVIRTVRAGSAPAWDTRAWFHNFEQSGGVVMDLGIHDIDFQRWCCGEVERVFARCLNVDQTLHKDHALISLRFVSGAVGHIECSWAHPVGGFRTRIEIAGTEGLIEWDSQGERPLRSTIIKNGKATHSHASPLAREDDPYYQELAHFLDCLENDKPFLVSPHDGLMAVKVSQAILASMKRGEPVTVAEFKEESA